MASPKSSNNVSPERCLEEKATEDFGGQVSMGNKALCVFSWRFRCENLDSCSAGIHAGGGAKCGKQRNTRKLGAFLKLHVREHRSDH